MLARIRPDGLAVIRRCCDEYRFRVRIRVEFFSQLADGDAMVNVPDLVEIWLEKYRPHVGEDKRSNQRFVTVSTYQNPGHPARPLLALPPGC